MRRSRFAVTSLRPPVLGLLLGALASGVLTIVLLGANAGAQDEPSAPQPLLDATHLPPLLSVPGEEVDLAFTVHCASGGDDDPEEPCGIRGSVFVRPESAVRFQEITLHEEQENGLRRLTASVPETAISAPGGFEYYAELEATPGGERLRIPSGADATYRTYLLPDAVDVRLPATLPEEPEEGTRVVSAAWGDGGNEVGLEPGRNTPPIGATSFDTAQDGTVLLLDEAHRRALRWAPGAARPERVPLSIDGRLADIALADEGSFYVLESVGARGEGPLVRHFDRSGRALDVVRTAERSPSQVRMGPDGPVVLQHPSHLWTPVASPRGPLAPDEQRRRGRTGRPLRSGTEVVTLRTGNELRVALVVRGRVRSGWRLTSARSLGEIQLAEPMGNRMVVVVRLYDELSDEFRVVVLDRRGAARQFTVRSADWAETAPLSRFRLVGTALYHLGSTPNGPFVDRYDLEVRR